MTTFALVLGAGGTVGLAYHAGALRALDRAGIKPGDADLIVGTSAGSVVGAYLRTGWTTDQFWDMALGVDEESAELLAEELDERRRAILAPLAGGPLDLARRGMGSAYVIARSLLRIPAPKVPRALARVFPAGLFEMAEGRRRFAEELPVAWPDRALWVCTVDIGTGRRIALGRPDAPLVSLPRAIAASCAIPGVYPPVRVGSLTLVDGGAHSTTNLDLAAKAGHRLIIGVAPMAFDTERSPSTAAQLVRRVPARQLSNEAALARAGGADVLLIRPTASEVRLHGANMMRRSGWDLVARAAYESTSRLLETDRFQTALSA